MPNLVIAYFTKSSTMKLALQRGELDMAFRTFTPTEYASLETTKGIKVWKGPGIEIRYLVFDMMRGPTDKLAVRQALAYLMPRETLVKPELIMAWWSRSIRWCRRACRAIPTLSWPSMAARRIRRRPRRCWREPMSKTGAADNLVDADALWRRFGRGICRYPARA